jgi:hypothetical protein
VKLGTHNRSVVEVKTDFELFFQVLMHIYDVHKYGSFILLYERKKETRDKSYKQKTGVKYNWRKERKRKENRKKTK